MVCVVQTLVTEVVSRYGGAVEHSNVMSENPQHDDPYGQGYEPEKEQQ
jgi:hypothetical protein